MYLDLADAQLLAQCEVETLRHSGPGGQHRNKTESGVRLTHSPTGITVTAYEERSQLRNREAALDRLKVALALGVREAVNPDAFQPPPTLAAVLPGARQQVRAANPRFWAGAAVLLDLFVACECSVSATATRLGISTGALSRLLLSDSRLASRANGLRAEQGLRPLRP